MKRGEGRGTSGDGRGVTEKEEDEKLRPLVAHSISFLR